MSVRSLEQCAASAEQPLSAVATDAPPIRVDRVPFGFLVRPRLGAAVRFTDLAANLQRLQMGWLAAVGRSVVGSHIVGCRSRLRLPIDMSDIVVRWRCEKCLNPDAISIRGETAMALPQEVINSEHVPRIGPYSQAVRVGNLVFTAGQPGVDPATGQAIGPTFEAQARQAFANLRAVLEDAGTGLHRVVKVTCFVTDMSAFSKLNELFAEFFPQSPPVRSTPVVALPKGLLFSVDAIAVAE